MGGGHPCPARISLARRTANAVVVAWLLSWATHAEAQDTEAVTLPVPVHEVAPVYPDEALAERLEATVGLEIDVDEDGRVVQAQVVAPAGHGFDEAALAAVRDDRFEPARDGLGRPVAVRIRYDVRFTLDAAPVVNVRGVLKEAGVREVLEGVGVRLEPTQGVEPARTATTDAAGAFSWADVPDGAYALRIDDARFRADPVPVEVVAGQLTEVTSYAVRLRPWEEDDDPDAFVDVVARATPEVTERRLAAEDVRVLPGSFGDVLRAVQNLPGVARSPFGLGTLIIRGTAPEDSRYTIDGVEVPLVFHFGGLTTVVNGDLLDEVVFLPGNFGVRYGRNQGGRVELRTRTDVPEHTHGYVSLDLFQASVYADIRLSERTALSVSLRRSYIDAVLNPVFQGSDQPIRAPAFWDGQLRLVHHMPGQGTLDALLVVSDDRFTVLGNDPTNASRLGLIQTYQQLRVRWRRPLQEGWRNELSLLVGPQSQKLALNGGQDAYERRVAIDVREEVVKEADDHGGIGWRLGLDLKMGPESFRFNVADFGPEEQGKAFVAAPSLYVEPTFRWGPVTLIAGVRSDLVAFGDVRTMWSIDPRLALRVDVSPTTTVRASVGRYSQFPTYRKLAPAPEGDGVQDLATPWALQTAVGFDQALPLGMSLEVTAFHTELFDQIVGREQRLRFFTVPPTGETVDGGTYANDGTGRAYGLELLFKVRQRRLVAWFSATLGRSERLGRTSDEPSLFTYDQPVVLNALFSYELPKRWRIGARVRYATGNPYTPIANRVYDLDSRRFAPIDGDTTSARLPPFWSLDVRVDKQWVFRKWALTFYLDVLNVTNTRSLEIPTWNADYSELEGIAGLPILPVFGLRGDW
ncbi:MAG: TonB-dependent receptor [Alphaproteobacteria bacterium]|nr:TonB-dependent receptor [Alphaproteobacteria bacterium]